MAEEYAPSIERGLTRINVGKGIAFAHPFAGPNTYREVAKQILGNRTARLSLPDGENTSFLLHAVYCGPEEFQKQPEAVELRDNIMRPRYLWVFNSNLWVPEKYKSAYGVFVVADEGGLGLSQQLDVGELEKRLKGGRKLKSEVRFSEDGKVGFAPRDTYKNGVMSPEDFAKDGFIVASNKEEGARKLAEVSKSRHFTYKQPRSWIVEAGKEPIQAVSAVLGYDGDRLGFLGYFLDGSWGGCAFGVLD